LFEKLYGFSFISLDLSFKQFFVQVFQSHYTSNCLTELTDMVGTKLRRRALSDWDYDRTQTKSRWRW